MINLNLGYVNYLNIVGSEKPISNLVSRKIRSIDGSSCYETLAELSGALKLSNLASAGFDLYGKSDGCGTDSVRLKSTFKAVSEAIESWAYYYTCSSTDLKSYGLNFDASSTGFAAFPEFGIRRVREISNFEAMERWAVANWWLRKLPIREVKRVKFTTFDIGYYEIMTNVKGVSVALIHGKCLNENSTQFSFYGFAASESYFLAANKAFVELDRNYKVLSRFYRLNDKTEINAIGDIRILYFSSKDGEADFLDTVNFSLRTGSVSVDPVKICDVQVVGEWSKYANVWRTLYKVGEYDLDSTKFFLF